MIAILIFSLIGSAFGQGCPENYGVQTYPNEHYCDKFYKCTNGTLTEETCANGLIYTGHGYVHNHCNYNHNWKEKCGDRAYDDTPISSPGCLYQYGIYPKGKGCELTFFKCAAGVAYETACQRGQAYSAEYAVCTYPDQVYECKGQEEKVIGFKCPSDAELPPNAIARRFLPYPRFAVPDNKQQYIVCVDYAPRIQNCGDYSYFDEATLSCVYDEHADPHYGHPQPHHPEPAYGHQPEPAYHPAAAPAPAPYQPYQPQHPAPQPAPYQPYQPPRQPGYLPPHRG